MKRVHIVFLKTCVSFFIFLSFISNSHSPTHTYQLTLTNSHFINSHSSTHQLIFHQLILTYSHFINLHSPTPISSTNTFQLTLFNSPNHTYQLILTNSPILNSIFFSPPTQSFPSILFIHVEFQGLGCVNLTFSLLQLIGWRFLNA